MRKKCNGLLAAFGVAFGAVLVQGCVDPTGGCVTDEECPDGYTCEQTGEGTLDDPYRNDCVLGGLLGTEGSVEAQEPGPCDPALPESCPIGHVCKAVWAAGSPDQTENRCVIDGN